MGWDNFSRWWLASKYCQVVTPEPGWEQIARDGWAAAARREAAETAWLIELRGNNPSWWSLTCDDDEDGQGWGGIDTALRFARKEDAEAYILHAGWTEAFPSEHMWVDPRPATLTEADEATEAEALAPDARDELARMAKLADTAVANLKARHHEHHHDMAQRQPQHRVEPARREAGPHPHGCRSHRRGAPHPRRGPRAGGPPVSPLDHLREGLAFIAVIIGVAGLLAWAEIAALLLH